MKAAAELVEKILNYTSAPKQKWYLTSDTSTSIRWRELQAADWAAIRSLPSSKHTGGSLSADTVD